MNTRIFVVGKITSFACLVRPGLNHSLQLKAQSRVCTKSLFSLEAETLFLFTTEKREVSSTNGRSLEEIRKNNGPRTEPCSTPNVTNFQTLRITQLDLSFKNDLMSLTRLLSFPLLLIL